VVRRAPVCKRTVTLSDALTVIIIGGGASGNAAAEKLHEDGFNGHIVASLYQRRTIYLLTGILLNNIYMYECNICKS